MAHRRDPYLGLMVDLDRFTVEEGTIFIRAYLHAAPVFNKFGPYATIKAAEALAERMRAEPGMARYREIEVHEYDTPHGRYSTPRRRT